MLQFLNGLSCDCSFMSDIKMAQIPKPCCTIVACLGRELHIMYVVRL